MPLPTQESLQTRSAGGPQAGGHAYDQLLQMYQKQYPNADLQSPQGQDQFNQWAGGVAQEFGVNNWEELPQDFANRYNPGGQAQPAGYQPPVQPTYSPAQVPVVPGGNYAQQQNSSQGGQFNTTGQTGVNQQQQTGQNTTQNQSGTQSGTQATNQTGTSQQQQTGQATGTTANTGTTTSTTAGTTTNKPIDTLGFGSLLQQAGQNVGAQDKQRSAFLQDVIANGGSAFNSQVDQAVRKATSGPGLTGAGGSATSRAGGYAAAEVARNNMGQRLQASEQLAGPTGLTTLSGAANPYIGQEQTTNNTTTGVSNERGTNTQNSTGTTFGTTGSTGVTNTNQANNSTGNIAMTGFQNLIGQTNEQNSGSTSAQGSQAAAGLIPQGQQVGGGGCVLCTAATELKLARHHRVLRKVIGFKLRDRRFDYAARGYFYLFTPLARWFLHHPRLAAVLWPMAKAVVYEELRVAGRRLPRRYWAWGVHWVGHGICALVGRLNVPKGVQCAIIQRIAQREKIWFSY